MKESTIQGLLATFQAIANMTEDETIIAICHEALARAEADREMSVKLPEPLLISIHLHMVAADALARVASSQPKEIKGKKKDIILAAAMNSALDVFTKMPEDRQHDLLIQSAKRLADLSGARTVEHRFQEL